MLEELEITCPYCGESFTTLVDCSAGDQRYIEDCTVCCRPIELELTLTTTGPLLITRRDDE